MKFFLTILIIALSISNSQAQLLKKLKEIAEQATEKAVNKVSQTFNPNTRLYKFVDKITTYYLCVLTHNPHQRKRRCPFLLT